MLGRPFASTTHTVELAQLGELEAALAAPGAPRFTAADLGVAGEIGRDGGGALPPNAVLTRLSWEGPPGYPYIHGIFAGPAGGTGGPRGGLRVELHTPALHELSHRLRLNHRWGV